MNVLSAIELMITLSQPLKYLPQTVYHNSKFLIQGNQNHIIAGMSINIKYPNIKNLLLPHIYRDMYLQHFPCEHVQMLLIFPCNMSALNLLLLNYAVSFYRCYMSSHHDCSCLVTFMTILLSEHTSKARLVAKQQQT